LCLSSSLMGYPFSPHWIWPALVERKPKVERLSQGSANASPLPLSRILSQRNCHDRISNNDGKPTFSPTIAESRTSQDAQKRQRAFFRPHCVPNPKIAEIHLLRHCRDREVMFGRRDTEHKAMEVYRYYRSLRDSLSDSRLKSLKSLKSFRSIPLS